AVGVWGAGGLGAHAVQLLRAVGAYPVIAVDPAPAARDRALHFGADLALDSGDPLLRERVLGATGGAGLEAAFDFAGVPAVREQALSVLAPKGRLVLVGLSDQPLTLAHSTRFSYLQHRILGHYGSEEHHVAQLVRLAEGGRLDFSRSVTDVLPLEEVATAVRRMETKEGDPVRLILRP
ncbi:zinc-binding dehydrogenase, partial [Streptomyces sp. MBT57]|nr:zinc-binding dehydrogenase [Streptomyces sp. MBT57]